MTVKTYLKNAQELYNLQYINLFNSVTKRTFFDDRIEKLPDSYLALSVVEHNPDWANKILFLLVEVEEDQIIKELVPIGIEGE